MASGLVVTEDIKNTAELLGSDLVIAYIRPLPYLPISYFWPLLLGYRLMGPTGSGKSNVRTILYYTLALIFIFLHALKMIDTLTGQPGRRSGSRLESCTTKVHAVRLYKHPVHGDRLVFVDTPGFDDTHKSDLEILKIVSSWLQKM